MTRFFKLFCLFLVAFMAASPSWGANIAWVGGDPGGVHDVAIATNWDPVAPAESNSWFINTDQTGNYPIYDGVSTPSINVWDVMVGRDDNWGMTHALTGPGYMEQTGGTLNVEATFQIGKGNSGLMNTYAFSGGFISKAANGDTKIGSEGSTAQLIMSNGAQYLQAGWSFLVGVDNGSNGTVTLNDYSNVTVTDGPFEIGRAGGTGQLNIASGASFYAKGWSSVGNYGNTDTHVSSLGTLTTSGNFTHSGPIFIGRSGGSGVWNQAGGTTSFFDRYFLGGDYNGNFASATSTLNINSGGTISLRQIVPWGNTQLLNYHQANYSSAINVDNGTLQVQYDDEGSAESFIASRGMNNYNVYIMAGGLTIDTNSNAAIRVPLKNGATQPGGTAGGGLTKTGAGELTLREANTYTGPTTVNYGVLRVPGTTTLATTRVSVAPGGTLQLGSASSLTSPLTSLNLDSYSTLATSLTTSAAGANAISAGTMVNKSGLNFVLGAKGLSLDTAAPYTLISNYNNTDTISVVPTVTMNIRGYTAAVNVGNTSTTATVSGTLANEVRTWTNVTTTGNWDVNTSANWTEGDTLFMELDNVVFTTNASLDYNVNVIGAIHPASILVSGADNYTFRGTGSIVGEGTTVTKEGASTAYFRNAGGVYYTGATTLTEGSLNFACGNVTLPGNIILNGGAIGVENADSGAIVTVTGNVTDNGTTQGLTKNGDGTMVLTGTSTYAGATTLNNRGTLQIGSFAQLGTSTDDTGNLVLNGMLHYTGAATTMTRGFTCSSDDGGLWFDNDIVWANVAVATGTSAFTKTGAGKWTINQNPTFATSTFGHLRLQEGVTAIHGASLLANDMWVGTMATATLTMDSGAMLHSNMNFNAGASDNGSTGYATVSLDSAQISTGGWFAIGHNNSLCGGTLTMTNGSVISSGGDVWFGNEGSHTTITMSNGSTLTCNGYAYLGENGGFADITLNDSSSMTFVNRLRVASAGNNGDSIIRMHGTSSITTGNPGYEAFALGRDGNNNGVIIMDGNNETFDRLSGSHIYTAGPLEAGRWGNGEAYGEINMSGASYITTDGYTMIGASRSTGKLVMSQVADLVSNNDFFLGSDGGKGTLTMSDSAHITVDYGMGLARYGMDGVAPQADITMTGVSELHGGSWVNLGAFANAIGNLEMSQGAWVDLGTSHTKEWCNFGLDTGTANITMSGGSRMTVANKGISLGEQGGSGYFTLKEGASLDVTATDPVRTTTGTDSLDYDNGALLLGSHGGTGIITVQDAGRVTAHDTDIQLGSGYRGEDGTNFGAGVFVVAGSGASVSTTGTGKIIIGNNGGNGVWIQASGTTTTPNPVILGEYNIEKTIFGGTITAGMGSLSLQGGVFKAPQITTHSNASISGTAGTLNFQGGTLQASENNANFITSDGNGSVMSLVVGKNGTTNLGAVIDTQGFNVTINETLTHDASITTGLDGGLKKIGTGALTLTANPTYDGNTVVDAGTLTVPVLNTPAASVYVADSAVLNATSIVADTLTIGGPATAASSAPLAAVPEPGTFVLLVLAGLSALLAWRRK